MCDFCITRSKRIITQFTHKSVLVDKATLFSHICISTYVAQKSTHFQHLCLLSPKAIWWFLSLAPTSVRITIDKKRAMVDKGSKQSFWKFYNSFILYFRGWMGRDWMAWPWLLKTKQKKTKNYQLGLKRFWLSRCVLSSPSALTMCRGHVKI